MNEAGVLFFFKAILYQISSLVFRFVYFIYFWRGTIKGLALCFKSMHRSTSLEVGAIKRSLIWRQPAIACPDPRPVWQEVVWRGKGCGQGSFCITGRSFVGLEDELCVGLARSFIDPSAFHHFPPSDFTHPPVSTLLHRLFALWAIALILETRANVVFLKEPRGSLFMSARDQTSSEDWSDTCLSRVDREGRQSSFGIPLSSGRKRLLSFFLETREILSMLRGRERTRFSVRACVRACGSWLEINLKGRQSHATFLTSRDSSRVACALLPLPPTSLGKGTMPH